MNRAPKADKSPINHLNHRPWHHRQFIPKTAVEILLIGEPNDMHRSRAERMLAGAAKLIIEKALIDEDKTSDSLALARMQASRYIFTTFGMFKLVDIMTKEKAKSAYARNYLAIEDQIDAVDHDLLSHMRSKHEHSPVIGTEKVLRELTVNDEVMTQHVDLMTLTSLILIDRFSSLPLD